MFTIAKPARPSQWSIRATTLAALAISAGGTHAAPLLVTGDVELRAFVAAVLNDNLQQDTGIVTVPIGDQTHVEAFVQPPAENGWWTGPRMPGRPDWSFASARIDSGGFGGVGSMGGSETPNDPGLLATAAFYSGRVTNLGDSGTITLSYDIPLMQVAYNAPQFNQELANVHAWLDATVFDGTGARVGRSRLFDYELAFSYFKPPADYGVRTFTASPDLLADGAVVEFEFTDDAFAFPVPGARVDPFSASRTLGIPAFGWVEYSYQMQTTLWTGYEGSGWAMYGDPFEVSAPAGEQFLRFDVGGDVGTGDGDGNGSPVPEPGSGWLVLAGLAFMAWRPRPDASLAC